MTRERDRIQENANKYTVKNCPCAYGFIDAPMYCLWKDAVPTCNTLCQDCTDCVIKRVIEECKERSGKCERCKASEDYQPTDCLDYCSNDDVIFVNGILKLFDIEEINK